MSQYYTVTIEVCVNDDAALIEAAKLHAINECNSADLAADITSPEDALIWLLDNTVPGAGYEIEHSAVENRNDLP